MIESAASTEAFVDRATLSKWIDPKHLDAETIEKYREVFTNHPAHILVIEDFLVSAVAGRLAAFLAGEVRYREEYGLFSVDGAVEAEAWAEAPDEDRFFHLARLDAPLPEFAMSANALTYLRFRTLFLQPALQRFFESVTGLALGASDDFGIHRMVRGDYLRPHSDDNRNRRLALVLYLSPDWEPSFGGTLLVENEGRRLAEVDPGYNSIVMFDVLSGASHEVAPILPAAEARARFTIGGWYHRPEPSES
jgi:hypothetical protein